MSLQCPNFSDGTKLDRMRLRVLVTRVHFANATAVPYSCVLGINPSSREKEPATDYRETVRATGGREDDAGAQGV